MNSLERANQNSNYGTYLSRMENSYFKSSKSFLTTLCKGKKVLDVGCASGTLLKPLVQLGFDVMGIDLNEDAVYICKESGYNVIKCNLYDLKDTFDTIIFSSVLHEFSSYTEEDRYTDLPIIAALECAYTQLNKGGQLLIRDGIKGPNKIISVLAKSEKIVEDFKKYLNDAPMYDDTDVSISDTIITAPAYVIKEFAYTYTWGKESYSREVNEQYGILTVEEWKNIVRHANFTIDNVIVSSDNYIDYVSKFFVPNSNAVQLFEQSTIIINATK